VARSNQINRELHDAAIPNVSSYPIVPPHSFDILSTNERDIDRIGRRAVCAPSLGGIRAERLPECLMSEPSQAPPPKWVSQASTVFDALKQFTFSDFQNTPVSDRESDLDSISAGFHFETCIRVTIEVAEKGFLSVAIGLLRQALEAITLVDAGFQPDTSACTLLADWRKDDSHGLLRKALEGSAWGRYGEGLWGESWADFFRQLAGSLQTYAHCSRGTLEWNHWVVMHKVPGIIPQVGDVAHVLVSASSPDDLKKARISIIVALLIFVWGRVVTSNRAGPSELVAAVEQLREKLSTSKLLVGADGGWSSRLLPHKWYENDDYIDD
jgi:hypothetical protein